MLHNLDSDSSKIIEAVRSTGVVVTEAMRLYVDYIVSNMKAIGTWQLSNAVYGFVGGTAESHKWNWKDLRDVDAAFRLSFSGGVTHSANGMQGNGTTGYADTKLNHSANLTDGNQGISVYLRTNYKSISSVDIAIDIGLSSTAPATSLFYIAPRFTDDLSYYDNRSSGITAGNSNGSSIGFFTGNTFGGKVQIWKNGIKLNEVSKTGITTGINANVYLLARNNQASGAIYFSPRQQSFSAIHQGLTDTQAQQQSQIVNNAQNILNRA